MTAAELIARFEALDAVQEEVSDLLRRRDRRSIDAAMEKLILVADELETIAGYLAGEDDPLPNA